MASAVRAVSAGALAAGRRPAASLVQVAVSRLAVSRLAVSRLADMLVTTGSVASVDWPASAGETPRNQLSQRLLRHAV